MKDFTIAEAADGGGLHPAAQIGMAGPFVKPYGTARAIAKAERAGTRKRRRPFSLATRPQPEDRKSVV